MVRKHKNIKVKICGITNRQDAVLAAKLGADAIGFVFYKKSPRFVSPYKVKRIIEDLPPFVTPVGVFVNQKAGAVMDIADFCGITTLQLHGDEDVDSCRRLKKYRLIKAFRVGDDLDLAKIAPFPVQAFLFDAREDGAFGGTGKTFNWELLKDKTFSKPFILSGGLNPQNVFQAIKDVKPYAVDASSGLEKASGEKDERLMRDFFLQIS